MPTLFIIVISRIITAIIIAIMYYRADSYTNVVVTFIDDDYYRDEWLIMVNTIGHWPVRRHC